MIEKGGRYRNLRFLLCLRAKPSTSPGKDETMQAFVITAYKDYEALKTLTLALSRRGLCVIHADAQGRLRRGRWTN